MPEIVYAQRSYGGVRLGTCDGIDRGIYGCWVSTAAMILTHYAGPGVNARPDWQMNPGQLDDLLTGRPQTQGGYANGCDGWPGALHALHPELLFEGRRSYGSVPADLSQLAMDLDQEKCLELDGFFIGLGYPTHYVRCWSWDGSTLVISNPWTGKNESYGADWAARAVTAIETYRLPGFRPAWAGPAPVPFPADTFTAKAVAGAHVRAWPTLDGAIVRTVGDQDETVTVIATTHGGPLIADNFGGPATNEWFQLSDGWMASAVARGEPPTGWKHEVPYPTPPVVLPPPSPPPTPPPIVPFTVEIPPELKQVVIWETSPTFRAAADYELLAKLDVAAVLIRAANSDGTGSHDPEFEAAWAARAPAAMAAGLIPVAWTAWYGPGSGAWGGVTDNVAAYLERCAHYTASRQFDTPAIVVDAENLDMPGLGRALALLSSLSQKPVLLCLPGDPTTFGLRWEWGSITAAVAGLMPQLYMGAWGTAMTYAEAVRQLKAVSSAPLLPVFDEDDPALALSFAAKARADGFHGCSYFCWEPGDDALLTAYLHGWAPPPPPPPPPPLPEPVPEPVPPSPPAGFWAWLRSLFRWLLG